MRTRRLGGTPSPSRGANWATAGQAARSGMWSSPEKEEWPSVSSGSQRHAQAHGQGHREGVRASGQVCLRTRTRLGVSPQSSSPSSCFRTSPSPRLRTPPGVKFPVSRLGVEWGGGSSVQEPALNTRAHPLALRGAGIYTGESAVPGQRLQSGGEAENSASASGFRSSPNTARDPLPPHGRAPSPGPLSGCPGALL